MINYIILIAIYTIFQLVENVLLMLIEERLFYRHGDR